MDSITNLNVKRSVPWEERSGRLHSRVKDGHNIVLHLGKTKVLLNPTEAASIKDQLNDELIGHWISILKTDIPELPMLLRTSSSSSKTAVEEESDSLHSIGGL